MSSEASNESRPTAQEVIQFVAEQVRMMDLAGQVEIDYEALARLDEMPEDEAAALIDRTMAEIFFS